MASSSEFVSFICEQLEGVGQIRARKMFGEFMIYVNDKPVVMVCDDSVFMKRLPCLEPLLGARPAAPPYEGAREHYVLDPDDWETLREAARLAEEVTPVPKKRNRRADEKKT